MCGIETKELWGKKAKLSIFWYNFSIQIAYPYSCRGMCRISGHFDHILTILRKRDSKVDLYFFPLHWGADQNFCTIFLLYYHILGSFAVQHILGFLHFFLILKELKWCAAQKIYWLYTYYNSVNKDNPGDLSFCSR